jgi:hypothetical protein
VRVAHREAHRAAIGIKKLAAKERFARAGMQEPYYSVYNFLCAEAHNDARALISRHIKENDAGVVRLTMYGDDLACVEAGLMQVHDALSAMTEAICDAFGLTEPDRTRVDTTFAAAKRWVTARELPAATAASVPGSE